jgi:hypothetical protein
MRRYSNRSAVAEFRYQRWCGHALALQHRIHLPAAWHSPCARLRERQALPRRTVQFVSRMAGDRTSLRQRRRRPRPDERISRSRGCQEHRLCGRLGLLQILRAHDHALGDKVGKVMAEPEVGAPSS